MVVIWLELGLEMWIGSNYKASGMPDKDIQIITMETKEGGEGF